MPDNDGTTIQCAADATEPTPPVVNDNCGMPITPTGPSIVQTPDPIVCSGTIQFTWTYMDCAENSHDWVYTYTVDDNTAPELTSTLEDLTFGLAKMLSCQPLNTL